MLWRVSSRFPFHIIQRFNDLCLEQRAATIYHCLSLSFITVYKIRNPANNASILRFTYYCYIAGIYYFCTKDLSTKYLFNPLPNSGVLLYTENKHLFLLCIIGDDWMATYYTYTEEYIIAERLGINVFYLLETSAFSPAETLCILYKNFS